MTATIKPKSGRSKTYFTIDVDGQPRTLFSVREGNTHDGLTVLMRSAEGVAGNMLAMSQSVEQRYSIHDSPNSPNENTIKHTLVLADGKVIDTHKQTRSLKGGRLTPLFFRSSPSLDTPRYDFKARAKDEQVSLGQHDHTGTTLHYGLFASGADGPKLPGSRKYRMATARFRQFTLYVPYCFTNLPSCDYGVIQHIAGGAPRIDAEPMLDTPRFIDDGLPPNVARAVAINRFSMFHEHVLARALEAEDVDVSGLPLLIYFLQELGPGLLRKEEASERFGKFVRGIKGVLPRKNPPRKLDFDLAFANFLYREER